MNRPTTNQAEKEISRIMSNTSFVIVIDTPSIKKYVFGTDPLNEIRGASARLDWLNQSEMERCLKEHPGMGRVEKVYANGGSAQFLVHSCDAITIKAACASMVRYIREQTGGEVGVVYGIAPLTDGVSYREAVRMARFQLRCQRDFATFHRSASLIPIMMGCESNPDLPATHISREGDILSKSSYEKAEEGRETRRRGLWNGWMEHLANTGPWPARESWPELRCGRTTEIGDCSSWNGYLGVVYADGNAMGKFVQAIDDPKIFHQFSRIVDESIREACFAALDQTLAKEIDKVRKTFEEQDSFEPLAADILLLGGDDLLVAVPSDRALDFALMVTNGFERLTKEKIANLPDAEARFFSDRFKSEGFTISCGVAVARSNYPFYLALDLAEQLLKNAKRQDSYVGQDTERTPARIDFHVVAGANSYALEQVREDTYRVLTDARRTLRPLSCSQLAMLRTSIKELDAVKFPHSKLHELQEAALAATESQAEWRIRDIFARSRHGRDRSQRRALWEAVKRLCPQGYDFDFPWFKKGNQRLLCVADLVDAHRLFPSREEKS